VTTPAGWYPDPEGSPGQRFWNGDAWTDHRPPDALPVIGAARPASRGPDKRVLIGLAAAAVVVLIVGAVVAVVLTMKNDAGDITVTTRQAEASSAAPSETEYVIVDLTVTNVSTSAQSFFASFNTLSDGTAEFEAADEAGQYVGNVATNIGPGKTIETSVVFDVPKGTDLESIWLRGGPLSDGVAVGL
jgi:hypothetical protein